MRQIVCLLTTSILLTLSSCEKFKTDAVTGREFLLRYSPRVQEFGPNVNQFTGEKGMSFSVSGPYRSIATGDEVSGDVKFYLREYISAKDMMSVGLETRSEGLVLATSGAFQLKAEIDGIPVRPLEVIFNVPNSTFNQSTELFFGSSDSTSFWAAIPPDYIYPLAAVGWADTSFLGNPQSGYEGFIYPQSYYFENGWMSINCDHFLGEGIPLTDVSVRPSSETNFNSIQLTVSMFFETENAYLDGLFDNQTDMFTFQNVPVGYEVTCLGVGVDNDQNLYFGMITFEIESNGIYTFNMEPITEQELEDILDGL